MFDRAFQIGESCEIINIIGVLENRLCNLLGRSDVTIDELRFFRVLVLFDIGYDDGIFLLEVPP